MDIYIIEQPKKKLTFLIGPPRIGSLGLSIMMNNDKCLAYHEGGDFETPNDAHWTKTYAHKMLFKSMEQDKHLFSCDTSCSAKVIATILKLQYAEEALKSGRVQFLYIHRDPALLDESMRELMQLDENSSYMMTALMASLAEAEKNRMASLKKLVPEHCVLEIHKPYRHFSRSQVMEIARFVGAIDEENQTDQLEIDRMMYLSQCNLSITKEMAERGGAKMNETDKKDSIKKPSNFSVN